MSLGLDQVTFAELRSSQKLIEVLKSKVQTLNREKFVDDLLGQRVNMLIELLRETLLDRYQALSIRAFAHIAVALDYFLIIHEEGGIHDHLPHGYSDDLKEIDKEIRRIVNEAAEFAQADPEPDPAELWTDVYA